ncbi:MAG TPA: hypothetical protein VIJ87_15515, partial [Pyrinomonadaceae bacterium]
VNMNGVLHSEHVISRSGIAVSPREVTRGQSRSLAASEVWRWCFFQPPVVERKRLLSNTAPG